MICITLNHLPSSFLFVSLGLQLVRSAKYPAKAGFVKSAAKHAKENASRAIALGSE
jgi:hypothetical protein